MVTTMFGLTPIGASLLIRSRGIEANEAPGSESAAWRSGEPRVSEPHSRQRARRERSSDRAAAPRREPRRRAPNAPPICRGHAAWRRSRRTPRFLTAFTLRHRLTQSQPKAASRHAPGAFSGAGTSGAASTIAFPSKHGKQLFKLSDFKNLADRLEASHPRNRRREVVAPRARALSH
jgi:hypothetical protein